MKIERVRPAVLQLTISTWELAALVAAARWVVEGKDGELPAEALSQLSKVIESYDAASRRVTTRPPAGSGRPPDE